MNFRLMSDRARGVLAAVLLGFAVAGCSSLGGSGAAPSASNQTTRSAGRPADAHAFEQIAGIIGTPGVVHDGVYTVTIPRDDLFVSIDGMDVPTAAGLASVFHFYQCSCGKTVMVGQFLLTDYETNDVVYALQKQNILVGSMGPYLLYEKPRLRCVRFQAEGKPTELARAVKSALEWMGKNRMPPPQKLTP